jgi:hypothetical protein
LWRFQHQIARANEAGLPGHLSKIRRATLRTTPESIKHVFILSPHSLSTLGRPERALLHLSFHCVALDRELSKSNMRSASSATRIFSSSRNNPAAAIVAALIVEIAGGRFAFPRERQRNFDNETRAADPGVGQAAFEIPCVHERPLKDAGVSCQSVYFRSRN